MWNLEYHLEAEELDTFKNEMEMNDCLTDLDYCDSLEFEELDEELVKVETMDEAINLLNRRSI